MTVRRVDHATIALEGACGAEDAETLLQALLITPGAAVDWRSCEAAHTAVVQVMLAAGAEVLGPPRSGFLQAIVEPALKPL